MADHDAAPRKVGRHLVGLVMRVDHRPRDTGAVAHFQRMINQRPTRDGDQGLWPVLGQLPHTGAETCGEDHQREGEAGHCSSILRRFSGVGAGRIASQIARRSARAGCARFPCNRPQTRGINAT